MFKMLSHSTHDTAGYFFVFIPVNNKQWEANRWLQYVIFFLWAWKQIVSKIQVVNYLNWQI